MFCQKCGSQINDSAKFCTICGAPIEAQPAPEAQGYAPYAEPATDAFVYAPVADAASEPANNPFVYAPPADVAPAPAPKKKSAKKVIIPIVAVVVAAAIAVGVYFGFFANKKYYISKMTTYYYDEDGELEGTAIYSPYGKFEIALETSYEDEDGDESYTYKFELDKNDKIIKVIYKDEEEDLDYSIDIEYEKEDGKQVGTGSHKNDDGVKEEIEIVYESKDEFTITWEEDGEFNYSYTCYINDDGYSVTEHESKYYKSIEICDGVKLIEYKSYSRDDEDDKFELNSSMENTYNKDGFLTEYVSKSFYGDEDYTYKTVYERDKNNVPTSITKYEDGEKVSHSKIDKEDDDKIVLEILDEDDETIGYEEYGFDGKKLTYTKTYDEDHELTSEATYNKNGLVEETIEYEDGKMCSKRVYEYEKR